METPEWQAGYEGKVSDAEPGPSSKTSRTVTADVSRQATCDEDSIEVLDQKSHEHSKGTQLFPHGHLHHKPSHTKSLFIEPPPVVKRPSKIKNDTFSFRSSLLSWDRTEQQDGIYCARSIHKVYAYTSNVRILGMTFGKTIAVEFTNEGIDSAVQTVHVGNQSWSTNRLEEARRRLGKYTHDQRKDIEAATAALKATEKQMEPDSKPPTNSESQDEPGPAPPESQPQNVVHQHPYVMVGFMGDESVPKETLRRILEPTHLFKELHRAHRHLRGLHRRILSLKECAGFSIYECDSSKGYHREVDLDRETERALAELWRSYCGHKLDYEGRWMNWIHHNFNNSSNNPEDGRLTLEFQLRWSVTKVVFWGVVPVLLSLAIGFWYMYSDHGEVTDKVAIAEAAWVIASYIVTTSALLLALLAVISQFGDI